MRGLKRLRSSEHDSPGVFTHESGGGRSQERNQGEEGAQEKEREAKRNQKQNSEARKKRHQNLKEGREILEDRKEDVRV